MSAGRPLPRFDLQKLTWTPGHAAMRQDVEAASRSFLPERTYLRQCRAVDFLPLQFALAASGTGSRRANQLVCRVAGMGTSFPGTKA